ncbi:alpha/beta hydrolase [Paenibacillus guangzhouensis]|uniref:alpha/beta hydrolase n=1 Tax=Paenibacillus guangzhouensis TaxID=1473112 RepID=UPI0012673A94|nr:alpha/beta hydrolase-fold protein [Paenibacillus guangzhouensis]
MNGQLCVHELEQRELLIYLPPSYARKMVKSYPVIYIHDRGDLFDPSHHHTLSEIEAMFADRRLPELIMVGIASAARTDEYTPWAAARLSDQRTTSDFGGQGDAYLSFIVDRCKPYIDRTFRTDAGSEMTGLLGKSLGGLISMYGAYRYPDVFGRIGSISGSYWYEGFVEFAASQPMARCEGRRRIYMDVGSLEGQGKQTAQREMLSRTEVMHAKLQANGFGTEELVLIMDEGATHEAGAFARRFPGALAWLYRE